MNFIGRYIYDTPISETLVDITKITLHAEPLTNVARAANGILDFCLELPKMILRLPKSWQDFIPSMQGVDVLLPFKAVVLNAKDFLSFLEIFNLAKKITSRDYWENTSGLRMANIGFQFLQKSVESVLLLPNKWNMLPLAKFANSLGNWTGCTVTVNFFWGVKDVFLLIASIFGFLACTQEIHQNEIQLTAKQIRIEQIQDLQNNLSNSSLQIVLKAFDDLQANRRKAPKESLDSLNNSLHQKLQSRNCSEKKEWIEKKKEQFMRRYFWALALGEDLQLSQPIPNDVRDAIQRQPTDMLHKRIEEIVEYKIMKTQTQITNINSVITKNEISRRYELSKIVVVSLGLLVTTGLTLTFLAPLAGVIVVSAWITSLIVGILCLYKTFYDQFCFKLVPLPSTCYLNT